MNPRRTIAQVAVLKRNPEKCSSVYGVSNVAANQLSKERVTKEPAVGNGVVQSV